MTHSDPHIASETRQDVADLRQLSTLLDQEIDLAKDAQRQAGVTPWVLAAATAALTWTFVASVEPAVDWRIVSILVAMIVTIIDLGRSVMTAAPRTSTARARFVGRPDLRRHSKLYVYRAFRGVFLAALAATPVWLGLDWLSPWAWILAGCTAFDAVGLLLLVWFLRTDAIPVVVPVSTPKRVAERVLAGILQAGMLVSALGCLLGVVVSASLAQPMTKLALLVIGLLFVADTYVLALLVRPQRLGQLVAIRRRIALGSMPDVAALRVELEVALLGTTAGLYVGPYLSEFFAAAAAFTRSSRQAREVFDRAEAADPDDAMIRSALRRELAAAMADVEERLRECARLQRRASTHVEAIIVCVSDAAESGRIKEVAAQMESMQVDNQASAARLRKMVGLLERRVRGEAPVETAHLLSAPEAPGQSAPNA